MPADPPPCPACDAATPLEVIRSDTRGLRWCYCPTCSKTALIDAEGRILHRGS